MLIRFLKKIFSDERKHYIGRDYTFLMEGGIEVTGVCIDITSEYFILETTEGAITLYRNKIMAENCHDGRGPGSKRLEQEVPGGYHIDEAQGLPMAAVARGRSIPKTDLQERLAEASNEADKLKVELGVSETLEDERRAAREEMKRVGSIIPDDMLYPNEEELDKNGSVDFGVSFGVDFKKDLRPLMKED